MKKLLGCLILLCLICSCTTAPVKVSDAINVPQSRLYAYQTKTPEATATIVAIRDSGFVASACYSALYIDDVLSAKFDVGEKAVFYVKPGEYILKYSGDPDGKGLCVWHDGQVTRSETMLKENQTKTFNLRITMNADLIINRAE